jgi:hypothetical protein
MDETDLLRSLTAGMAHEDRASVVAAMNDAARTELDRLIPIPTPTPTATPAPPPSGRPRTPAPMPA